MVTAIRAERAEKEWWIVSGINLLCLHQPFWRPGLGFPGRSNSNTTDSDWGGSNSFQPLWLKSPFLFTFFTLLPYHHKPTGQLCGLYLFWLYWMRTPCQRFMTLSPGVFTLDCPHKCWKIGINLPNKPVFLQTLLYMDTKQTKPTTLLPLPYSFRELASCRLKITLSLNSFTNL